MTTANKKHDTTRIAKTLEIRATARKVSVDEMLQGPCPICARGAHDGHFRADARGHAIEGCVDAHHAQAYRGLASERSHFYFRAAARGIRADMLKMITH